LYLRKISITNESLALKDEHPEYGSVTLKELLAVWEVHNHNHLPQIPRVLAYRYQSEVGPWKAYWRILN